mmetsp:Transcript_28924/g.93256  ORF Transcript_28924/g.93256 Transcript_28924/m.93256 type:complete len:90 (+) Transcript_28924:64-333(+)
MSSSSSSSSSSTPAPPPVKKLSEEEDCGFCVYMRAGPCGGEFTRWEDCVRYHQDRDEDFARKCTVSTTLLTKCMQRHAAYYDMPGLKQD